MFVFSVLLFSCRSTYNISNKHIKGEINPRLPNLKIEFDKRSFVYVLGNPLIATINTLTKWGSVETGVISGDGYLPRETYGKSISSIEKSYNLNFDSIPYEKNSVSTYESFIEDQIKSKFISQNPDNPVGVIEFKFPTMENMKFKKFLWVPCVLIPGLALGVPYIIGWPSGIETCKMTIECNIKDLKGNIIKTYSSEGIGNLYCAAWYGYKWKYSTDWYMGNISYSVFRDLILPQRVNAISDALNKISKKIAGDRNFLQNELSKK